MKHSKFVFALAGLALAVFSFTAATPTVQAAELEDDVSTAEAKASVAPLQLVFMVQYVLDTYVQQVILEPTNPCPYWIGQQEQQLGSDALLSDAKYLLN
ncbi:hypothetical protein ACNOYE_38880 [Nannocystaceae bacterium ST9]